MDNEEIQRLLNKVLSFSVIEKNNFYHTVLAIVKKNTEPNKCAGEIIKEFDELLEQKCNKLDSMLNNNLPSEISPSTHKPSAIFRRVQ